MDGDDWTNELTLPVPNCSFYRNGQFKVFEWKLDAITISGFFSPVNQKATQFIVDQCLTNAPAKHAMPQLVSFFLEFFDYISFSRTNSNGTYTVDL